MKHRLGAIPLEKPLAASKAARDALKAILANGRMDCVYQFADGRRAAIVNCGIGWGTMGTTHVVSSLLSSRL
jgi:hypothetical protein